MWLSWEVGLREAPRHTRRRLMQVVFRLMAHLIDDRPADTTDRILQTMARVAPRV